MKQEPTEGKTLSQRSPVGIPFLLGGEDVKLVRPAKTVYYAMKTLSITLPDDVIERFEKLVIQRGDGYVSVNTNEVNGRDALFADLLMFGLDELEVSDSEIPDDVD